MMFNAVTSSIASPITERPVFKTSSISCLRMGPQPAGRWFCHGGSIRRIEPTIHVGRVTIDPRARIIAGRYTPLVASLSYTRAAYRRMFSSISFNTWRSAADDPAATAAAEADDRT
jgi:hypothetical protein